MSVNVDLEDFGDMDDLTIPVERSKGGIWV